jgi:hypothetical protein
MTIVANAASEPTAIAWLAWLVYVRTHASAIIMRSRKTTSPKRQLYVAAYQAGQARARLEQLREALDRPAAEGPVRGFQLTARGVACGRLNRAAMAEPTALRLNFDRRLMLQFRGSAIITLPHREKLPESNRCMKSTGSSYPF